ncbi:hypothetical protein GCM10010404_38740 [Nonomuraea africana]
MLLVAGLLTPPYLLGLYLVGDANPANSLMWLEPDAYTGRHVEPEAFNLGWSPPTLTAVLAAAAIAQVWGVLRLAHGLAVAPSPRVARLLFLQPAWYAAYLAVCSFDLWFTSVTARPATLDEDPAQRAGADGSRGRGPTGTGRAGHGVGGRDSARLACPLTHRARRRRDDLLPVRGAPLALATLVGQPALPPDGCLITLLRRPASSRPVRGHYVA